ncbi:hypothetical protein Hanom_Chr16g01423641 [Helianthus anomalus]
MMGGRGNIITDYLTGWWPFRLVTVGCFVKKTFCLKSERGYFLYFLETYTRMFWSPESLYYNPVWHGIVATWETLVYSPILDLDR